MGVKRSPWIDPDADRISLEISEMGPWIDWLVFPLNRSGCGDVVDSVQKERY